jgi:hypothetical protein
VFSCRLFGPCADGIRRFPENEGKQHFRLASLVVPSAVLRSARSLNPQSLNPLPSSPATTGQSRSRIANQNGDFFSDRLAIGTLFPLGPT